MKKFSIEARKLITVVLLRLIILVMPKSIFRNKLFDLINKELMNF